MKGRPQKNTHPNKSTVCANNFGTVCTNCPPSSLLNKQKTSRKSLHKLFVQTVFIWVGGFLGGSPSLERQGQKLPRDNGVTIFSTRH